MLWKDFLIRLNQKGDSFIRGFFLVLISVYQVFLSGFMGGNCRFYPSCSDYAKIAFERHSIFEAIFMTLKRIWICRPFGKSGYDPVPLNKEILHE